MRPIRFVFYHIRRLCLWIYLLIPIDAIYCVLFVTGSLFNSSQERKLPIFECAFLTLRYYIRNRIGLPKDGFFVAQRINVSVRMKRESERIQCKPPSRQSTYSCYAITQQINQIKLPV